MAIKWLIDIAAPRPPLAWIVPARAGWPSIMRRSGHAPARWLALLGAVAILLTVGTRLAATPVEESAPAARSVSVAAVTPRPSARPGCWVSGDLVGDANPARVRASLCRAP